jgi:hypothetical protein
MKNLVVTRVLSALLTMLLTLGPAHSFATGISTDGEKAIHTAKIGDFDATLIMTQDSESILATNTGLTFTMFAEATDLKIGEGIEALLLFRGCATDSNGDCLVTADYVIEAPDGSTYQKALNTDVWREARSSLVQQHLTNTRVGFLLQPGSDAGLYKVRVTVSDKIKNIQLSLLGKVMANAPTHEESDEVQQSLEEVQTDTLHNTSEGISVTTE